MSNAPAAGQALDVLEHLSRHAEPVPAASIARDLGLPRSTAYHLLSVLQARGYVTHYVEERRFGLGQAAYELGSAYQRQAPFARLARGRMRRLVDQCGRNAHFATLDGRDVIYLLEERAPGQPMLVTDVGVRLDDPDLGFTTGQAAAPVTWMCAATWLPAVWPCLPASWPVRCEPSTPTGPRSPSATSAGRSRSVSCAASSLAPAPTATPARTEP